MADKIWTKEEIAKERQKTFEYTAAGFAGIGGPGGHIVDRREYPDAIPIPKNDLLGVPEPQPLPEEPET